MENKELAMKRDATIKRLKRARRLDDSDTRIDLFELEFRIENHAKFASETEKNKILELIHKIERRHSTGVKV